MPIGSATDRTGTEIPVREPKELTKKSAYLKYARNPTSTAPDKNIAIFFRLILFARCIKSPPIYPTSIDAAIKIRYLGSPQP